MAAAPDARSAPRLRVAVCVSTLNRKEGLARLLRSLDQQVFEGPRPELQVVVTDNDPAGSAREIVAALEAGLGFRIRYQIEPRRGITYPRNAALEFVRGEVDLLGFVDDDEEMDPRWLDTLLAAFRTTGADVVTGPQVPLFEAPPPPWLARFFAPNRHRSGVTVDRAYTNNVLARASLFEDPTLRFDDRFAITGGSDTHLFRRIHRAGHRIVWVDEAIGRERVPASRVRARWVLARAFRFGATTALIERDLNPGLRALENTVAVGFYRLLKGTITLPLALVFGRGSLLQSVRHLFYGAGLLSGWCGLQYREYRTLHGR